MRVCRSVCALVIVQVVLTACHKKSGHGAAGAGDVPAATAGDTPADSAAAAAAAAGRPTPSGAGAHQADPRKLTDAELRFGIAPTRNSEVTYQDGVILMEHGERAVRSQSSDGMSWTLDAHALHADEIDTGKVLFATSRAVGRVLAVKRDGDSLRVTLGPVALTDVIKEANISYHQPLDMTTAVAYTAPNFPSSANPDSLVDPYKTAGLDGVDRALHPMGEVAVTLVSPVGSLPPEPAAVADRGGEVERGHARSVRRVAAARRGRPLVRPVMSHHRGENQAQQLPGVRGVPAVPPTPAGLPDPNNLPPVGAPQVATPPPITISDFTITPFCQCGGLGVEMSHEGSGLTIVASGVLYVKSPSVHFDLWITKGVVRTATVSLEGGAGLTVRFNAGSIKGLSGNVDREIAIPVDLVFPLVGLPVPLSVVAQQTVYLKTAFSAQNSTLTALGDYGFGGAISMGYFDGHWGAGAPTSLSTHSDLANSISGLSVGINSLVVGFGSKVLVGIGAFGFAVGPYASYLVSVSALKSPTIGWACRQATLQISVDAGVGYAIPKPIVTITNFFLHALNLKEISTVNNVLKMKPPWTVLDKRDEIPDGCSSPSHP